MDSAIAFYDYGRWVADCPNPACSNALELELGQQQWLCRFPTGAREHPRWEGCGTTAPIAWPEDPAAVEASLAGMPESAQHWKPEPAND